MFISPISKNVRAQQHLKSMPTVFAVMIFVIIVTVKADASNMDDAKEVAALDTQYQAAMKVNDTTTMDRILADDFILVTGRGVVATKADLVKDARQKQTIYEHQEEKKAHRRCGCGVTPLLSRRYCGSRVFEEENRSIINSGSVTLMRALQRAGATSGVKPRYHFQGKRILNKAPIRSTQPRNCERAVGESFSISGRPFRRPANSSAISFLQRVDVARAAT